MTARYRNAASRLLRIHQDERHPARRVAAVDPGVVGRLLHNHVAGVNTFLSEELAYWAPLARESGLRVQ